MSQMIEGSDSRAITIELSREVERKVQNCAAAQGRPVADYLRDLIERSVMSFDEILDPIREGFVQGGHDDAELEELFSEAREEVFHQGTTVRRLSTDTDAEVAGLGKSILGHLGQGE